MVRIIKKQNRIRKIEALVGCKHFTAGESMCLQEIIEAEKLKNKNQARNKVSGNTAKIVEKEENLNVNYS